MSRHDRRAFMARAAAAVAGAPLLRDAVLGEVGHAAQSLRSRSPQEAAQDEAFWYHVQRAYVQSPHFLNLEGGYYNPTPQPVLEARVRNIRMINEIPSFYMRHRQAPEREVVKGRLAELAGVSTDEIVISRNTTESLNTVILGLKLDRGDEAIMDEREYPNMLAAFRLRARRDGIRLKMVRVPEVPESDDQILRIYEEAITKRTKVILVSHMINRNGQILPVRRICDMAHERGIEVICDAAHSFAHLVFKIPDLGCDYLGSSLHKWLAAPLGSGLLYVAKGKVERVWPLFGDSARRADDDIRKFESVGTQPVSTQLSISNAIRFLEMIGPERKQARLHYLKSRWAHPASKISGVTLNTPLEEGQSCAIANVSVAGVKPQDLERRLFDEFRILTVAVDAGVRVSPNLFTTPKDVDRLVAALRKISS